MWSLDRGISCTAERGSGRIRSGRICTLACLILEEKNRETMTRAVEKQRGKEGSVKEGSKHQMKLSR